MTTALEKPDMNTEELLAGQTITPERRNKIRYNRLHGFREKKL